MKVALNGAPKRVIAVFGGNEQATALYQGSTKLWPSDGNYAMGLRVETPQPGTEDYLYWQHTLNALDGADAGTSSCYLRFSVNGEYYYLGASPDGSAALQMEGSVIQLSSGIRSILADYVGSTLAFEAVVPSVTSANFSSPGQNQGLSGMVLNPWLPGTTLTYHHYKGQKKVCSWASGSVTGLTSKTVYITAPWHNHEGHWRGDSKHICREVDGLVPDYSGEPLCIQMSVGGSSGITKCYLTFPAFQRVFQLKVKEVY